MDPIIDSWINGLLTRTGPLLNNSITVIGNKEKFPYERASATMTISPASEFFAYVENAENMVREESEFAEFFIFGVLDIFVTSEYIKLSRISIRVSNLVIDRIISTNISFRHAGQDAGLKILEILEKNKKNGEKFIYERGA